LELAPTKLWPWRAEPVNIGAVGRIRHPAAPINARTLNCSADQYAMQRREIQCYESTRSRMVSGICCSRSMICGV
jgi:hypothetical protein